MKIKKLIEVEIEVGDDNKKLCGINCKYHNYHSYKCMLFDNEIHGTCDRLKKCIKKFGVKNDNKKRN